MPPLIKILYLATTSILKKPATSVLIEPILTSLSIVIGFLGNFLIVTTGPFNALAAMQLSGKLDKPTTTPTVSYSEEELASIRNALGITTTADEGETSSDSSDATTAPENESTSEEATSEENGEGNGE